MFLHIAYEGHKLTVQSSHGDRHYQVKPACKDGEGGHWYCDVHAEHFNNNFAVHVHHGHWTKSKCLIVWLCNDHGAETINAETREAMDKNQDAEVEVMTGDKECAECKEPWEESNAECPQCGCERWEVTGDAK